MKSRKQAFTFFHLGHEGNAYFSNNNSITLLSQNLCQNLCKYDKCYASQIKNIFKREAEKTKLKMLRLSN